MSGQFELNNNLPILTMLSNSIRIGGENRIDVAANGVDPTEAVSQVLEYFLGLLTPMIIMSIFFLGWCIVTPSLLCCKDSCKSVLCLKIWFYFCLFWSMLCWFISFRGINLFDNGVEATVNLDDVIFKIVDDTLTETQDIIDEIPSINLEIDNMNQECGDFDVGKIPEVDDVEGAVNLEDVSKLMNDIDEVGGVLGGIDVIVDELASNISLSFGASMALVFFYMIPLICCNTAYFYDEMQKAKNDKHKSNGFVDCQSNCAKTFGCVAFTCCGCCLSSIALSAALSIGILATFGADVCTPSPVAQILGVITGEDSFTIDDARIEDFCGLDSLDGANDEEIGAYFACHYLMCQGENLILKGVGINEIRNGDGTLDRLQSDFLDNQVELLKELQQEVADNGINNGVDPADVAACDAALDSGIQKIDDVFVKVLEVVEVITCDSLTGTLRGFVDVNSCNGFIAGLGVIYVSWTSASCFLLLALAVYPLLMTKLQDRSNQRLFSEANTYATAPVAAAVYQPAQPVTEEKTTVPDSAEVKTF